MIRSHLIQILWVFLIGRGGCGIFRGRLSATGCCMDLRRLRVWESRLLSRYNVSVYYHYYYILHKPSLSCHRNTWAAILEIFSWGTCGKLLVGGGGVPRSGPSSFTQRRVQIERAPVTLVDPTYMCIMRTAHFNGIQVMLPFSCGGAAGQLKTYCSLLKQIAADRQDSQHYDI